MSAGAVMLTVLGLVTAQVAPAPPPVRTGLVLGRVVDASSGRPIPGAIVTLEGGAAAGPSGTSPRAITNANGQFVFRRLAKGSYYVTATRNGYADGAFGRRRPAGTMLSLPVDTGQRVVDVSIRLWRFASISGTVTDEAGEPLIGVGVTAFQRRALAGRTRIVQSGMATTDDRGVYRFPNLIPGDYLVGFVPKEVSIPASVNDVLQSPSSSDAARMDLMRERLAIGGGGGLGTAGALEVGNMVRQVDSGPPPPGTDTNALFIYPTQFFSNASSASKAAVLTLESGQQRENVDFTVRPVRAVRVSGSVIGADGPGGHLGLRLVPLGDDALTEMEVAGTISDADGAFTFLGVPPGQYAIRALRVPRPPLAPRPTATTQIQMGNSMIISSSGGTTGPAPIPDEPTIYADVAVSVANRDVTDVVVPLQRGARILGRVEFDGTHERPDGAALRRIPIVVERADRSVVNSPGTTIPPGQIDESGAFKTYGVPAGRYLVRVGSTPPNWYLKSVISDGRDVADAPFEVKASDTANVVITFTDRPNVLTGNVRGADNNADPEALVVVFPADPGAWSDYGLNPRRMRSLRPGRDGRFTLTGLPAGDYYVAAIREERYAQWQDPQVLEELASSATHVHFGEGDTRTQDLKTIGGRQ